ncbi:MAG TPA: DinB family protein [Candidatus Angelobacter sp.]|nr:DinB family protein [Candidatus Angelobacter sp.]
MTPLTSTVAADFASYYQDAAKKILALVAPLSDDQIWTKPYLYGNSIGHLLLHLTGNLGYYVGTEIAGTGYVRNRPLEFTDASRAPKSLLVRNFADAIGLVVAELHKQKESDWSLPYSGKGMDMANDRFRLFLHCHGHLCHHYGQMMYLVKEMERQGLRVDRSKFRAKRTALRQ